ncbi:MAG: CBS domain-containing protein [Saprospiraceae bacterium]|jgi:CBS domain-containing protein|nr:CBS domain-containing protein [Saprospiraceae bacterium]MBK9566981.1 CBS domain-containing protein [Saprospiraceae bacterium]
MNLLNSVSSIMTPNPICVNSKDTLTVVDKLLKEHRIHHLPVISDGKLVGMVSKSDFLFFRRGFSDENSKLEDEVRMNNFTVKDIMTKRLAKLEPTDKINVALEVFKENLFHALPVVEGDKIVGIVSTFDIIKRLAIDAEATAAYE